jgi:transcriptional regulator of acetoin/glycerol metabolism
VQFVAARCRRCKRKLAGIVCLVPVIPVLIDRIVFPALLPTLAETESQLMDEALRRTEGGVMQAAALIDVGKTTFYRKLAERGSKA